MCALGWSTWHATRGGALGSGWFNRRTEKRRRVAPETRRLFAQTTRTLLALFGLVTAGACTRPGARPAPVALRVHATVAGGESVAGVHVWINGEHLGMTGLDGSFETAAQAGPSGVIYVIGTCPAGYQSNDKARRVVLTDAEGEHPSSNGPAGEPVQIELRCRPTEVAVALVVRTAAGSRSPLADVIVEADGVVVGETDDSGNGHFLVHRSAQTAMQVTLDGSAHSDLVSPQQVVNLRLSDSDQIVLIERNFARHVAPRRRPSYRSRKPHSRPPIPSRPFRIR